MVSKNAIKGQRLQLNLDVKASLSNKSSCWLASEESSIVDARLIRSTALRTTGAACPSSLDAYAWRRLCPAFKSSLCQSLAEVAKRLYSSFIDPQGISPLLACRLIALDKCPGVRLIVIGETARRIIAKTVLTITRADIQEAAGSLQLCGGQISGCEAAVHSTKERFLADDTLRLQLLK